MDEDVLALTGLFQKINETAVGRIIQAEWHGVAVHLFGSIERI